MLYMVHLFLSLFYQKNNLYFIFKISKDHDDVSKTSLERSNTFGNCTYLCSVYELISHVDFGLYGTDTNVTVCVKCLPKLRSASKKLCKIRCNDMCGLQ